MPPAYNVVYCNILPIQIPNARFTMIINVQDKSLENTS